MKKYVCAFVLHCITTKEIIFEIACFVFIFLQVIWPDKDLKLFTELRKKLKTFF